MTKFKSTQREFIFRLYLHDLGGALIFLQNTVLVMQDHVSQGDGGDQLKLLMNTWEKVRS